MLHVAVMLGATVLAHPLVVPFAGIICVRRLIMPTTMLTTTFGVVIVLSKHFQARKSTLTGQGRKEDRWNGVGEHAQLFRDKEARQQ